MEDADTIVIDDTNMKILDDCVSEEDEDVIPVSDNGIDNEGNANEDDGNNEDDGEENEKEPNNDDEEKSNKEVEVIEYTDKTDGNKNQPDNKEDDDAPVIVIDVPEKIQSDGEDDDDEIDFTADVNLDQLSELDSMRSTTQLENINKENEGSDIVILKDSRPGPKNPDEKTGPEWYETKLNEKMSTAKERLSKLSKVLKNSYDCYKDYLERIEAASGSPVCRVINPWRCPLDRPHINRWKFACTKKPIEENLSGESNKEDDKIDRDHRDDNKDGDGDGAGDGGDDTVNNKIETVWRLEPCDGGSTANANNGFQAIPDFVMRAVKVFEEFINSTNEDPETDDKNDEETDEIQEIKILEKDQEGEKSEDKEKPAEEATEKENDEAAKETEHPSENIPIENMDQWMWLLVRSNSKDELMLFAAGRAISGDTMEKLKKLFESGKGNECNIKSLYCKSLLKVNNVQTANTTFLVGTEALDETVGDLKIQLAPKTNFWLNTDGAEQLAKAVEFLLFPNPTITVLDIGCGLGLIGLMMASKCKNVIGLDVSTEIEEAEMTCELNKITNASYITGNSNEMLTTLAKKLTGCRASAVVNASTNIGRNIEIMKGLRKLPNVRRVVIVTTLTKQSARSILELIQPASDALGDPFIPTRAVVVDTLATGPQFEVVIRMERRTMRRVLNSFLPKNPSLIKNNNTNNQSPINNNQKVSPQKGSSLKDNTTKGSPKETSQKESSQKTNAQPSKSSSRNSRRRYLSNRRARLAERAAITARGSPKKLVKNPFFDKPTRKTWHAEKPSPSSTSRPSLDPKAPRTKSTARSRRRIRRSEAIIDSKSSPRRKREWENDGSRGGRSGIPEKRIREHDDDLRFRLSGNRSTEPDLLQKMRDQQRMLEAARVKLNTSAEDVRGSTAQQIQDILNLAIEHTNQVQTQLRRSVWERIAPPDNLRRDVPQNDDVVFRGRQVKEIGQQDIIITTPNREFLSANEMSHPNYPSILPGESNPMMPNDYMPEQSQSSRYDDDVILLRDERNDSWSRGNSRKDGLPLSRRNLSPRRDNRRDSRRSPPRRSLHSPQRRQLSPPRRPISPSRRPISPPRRQISPSRRPISPPRRLMSPSRRLMSPPRQQMSSPERYFSQYDIQQHRQMSPPRHFSPPRRPVSPLRHRAMSPPRRQSPSRRQPSPMRIPGDDWDIPSRGASQQHPHWQQSLDNRSTGPRFDPLPPPLMSKNTQIGIGNGNNRMSGGGDAWNSNMGNITPENRFGGGIGGQKNDWNPREKEMFNHRGGTWVDGNMRAPNSQANNSWNTNDKDDWNDLPEDARDPWGDDGPSSLDRDISGPSFDRGMGGNDRGPLGKDRGLMGNDRNLMGNERGLLGNDRGMSDRWSFGGNNNSSQNNWPLSGSMGQKPSWQSNMGNNQSGNNSRWSLPNSNLNMPQVPSNLSGNWAAGSTWRPMGNNMSSGFPSRPFNNFK